MSKFLKNTSMGDKIRCSPRLKLIAQREAEARSRKRQSYDEASDLGRKNSSALFHFRASDVGRKNSTRKRTNVRSRLGSKVDSHKKPNKVSETPASEKRKREDKDTNKRLKYDRESSFQVDIEPGLSIADKLDDSMADFITIDDDSMMEMPIGPRVDSHKKPNKVSETPASEKRKREDKDTNKRLKYDGESSFQVDIEPGLSIADKLDDSMADFITIDDDSLMEMPIGPSSQTKSEDSRQDTNLELNNIELESEPGTSCTITASTSSEIQEDNDIGGQSRSPSCSSRKDETSMILNFNDTIDDGFLFEDQILDCGSDMDESIDKRSAVQVAPTPAKSEATCVVVDTNIFIHYLSVLKKVLNHDTPTEIVVFVPWVVVQELDRLKDTTNLKGLKQQVRDCLAWIHEELKEKKLMLLDQSVDDLSNQGDLGKGLDDRILACCLQQQKKYQKVILLSNDINLGNKAICNNVEALRPDETNRLLDYTDSITKIQDKMALFLSEVIVFCCQETFGSKMKGIKTLQGMPWTYNGCLQRIIIYWHSVFRIFLLEKAKKVVGTLINLTKNGIGMDGKFRQFETKIKELLVFIADIPQYNSAAKQLKVDLSH